MFLRADVTLKSDVKFVAFNNFRALLRLDINFFFSLLPILKWLATLIVDFYTTDNNRTSTLDELA